MCLPACLPVPTSGRPNTQAPTDLAPRPACSHVFRLLNEYDVMLEGILLKPNMILPGGWAITGCWVTAVCCRQCSVVAACTAPGLSVQRWHLVARFAAAPSPSPAPALTLAHMAPRPCPPPDCHACTDARPPVPAPSCRCRPGCPRCLPRRGRQVHHPHHAALHPPRGPRHPLPLRWVAGWVAGQLAG